MAHGDTIRLPVAEVDWEELVGDIKALLDRHDRFPLLLLRAAAKAGISPNEQIAWSIAWMMKERTGSP